MEQRVVILLFFLWVVKSIKTSLFWVYLWQLKEYHVGRFISHFKTANGKRAVLNKVNGAKAFLLLLIILGFPADLVAIFISGIYLLEIIKRRIIKPTKTKKTVLLSILGFIALVWLGFSLLGSGLYRFSVILLFFDLLSPVVISGIVLLTQPFTVFWRLRVIHRAGKKRKLLSNLKVIGITGSYGKTSVKEFLSVILSRKFRVAKTINHRNSEIGISLSILENLAPDDEIFICEMGAYNRNGVKYLMSIANPSIGILTGINSQHLDTFGSQENIIKTKYEIVSNLQKPGLAVLNFDSDLVRDNFREEPNVRAVKCSAKERYDLWAEEISVSKDGLSFRAVSKNNESAVFETKLLGSQNIINLLLASACAMELGMSLSEIALAIRTIGQELSGVRLIEKRGVRIIDATYSANPDSVLSHLDYLYLWEGKRIIVMPSLIELGSSSDSVHQQIGQKISEVCEKAFIVTKEGVSAMKVRAANAFFEPDPEKIIREITPGTTVLLESRVPQRIINFLEND